MQKYEKQQPPTFRPMSIVAKRSPISATAELLFRYASVQTVYTERQTNRHTHADRNTSHPSEGRILHQQSDTF